MTRAWTKDYINYVSNNEKNWYGSNWYGLKWEPVSLLPDESKKTTTINITKLGSDYTKTTSYREERESMKIVKPNIVSIEVVNPNKVMIVAIDMVQKDKNGKILQHITKADKIKVVVKEPDVFDMRRGCFIALAKYLYGADWTIEGVEFQADQMMMQKEYVKIVDRAIKNYNAELRAKEKMERIEKENKEIARRKREKNQRKRKANLKKVKLEAEMWRDVSKKLFDARANDRIQDDNK